MPVSPPLPLSVVVPARNAERSIAACLAAIHASARGDAEIIVVDDGSTDRTAAIARASGAVVVSMAPAGGPARARNAGARRARSPIVLFVDADVTIAEDAIPRVVRTFADDPTVAAVFGSYDDAPTAGTLVSDYRNLLHHFVHQSAREESGSFWAGCGAVRQAVFVAVGGFDERYVRPSIEDIELGGRLRAAGSRVRLDKRLLARHTKRWTIETLVRSDVRDRAYPWSRLILRQGRLPADLNLQPAHRASAVFVWLALASLLALAAGWPPGSRGTSGAIVAGAIAVVAWLNWPFYRFLWRRRGVGFTAAAFALHALYYAYASATFAWAWVCHHAAETRDRVRRVDRPGPVSGVSS